MAILCQICKNENENENENDIETETETTLSTVMINIEMSNDDVKGLEEGSDGMVLLVNISQV